MISGSNEESERDVRISVGFIIFTYVYWKRFGFISSCYSYGLNSKTDWVLYSRLAISLEEENSEFKLSAAV